MTDALETLITEHRAISRLSGLGLARAPEAPAPVRHANARHLAGSAATMAGFPRCATSTSSSAGGN